MANEYISQQSEQLNLQSSDELSKEFEKFLNDDSMLESCTSAHNANNNDLRHREALTN